MYKRFARTALAIIFAVVPMVSAAQEFPQFPMAFWGTATVNGNPIPLDSTIRAYYGDELAGQVTVQEQGIYGYAGSTEQKLVVGRGSGAITFRLQSTPLNSGVEAAGTTPQTYSRFVSGETVERNLGFTLFVPTPTPTPVSTSGGGGGGGGGGGFVSQPTPIPSPSPTPQVLGETIEDTNTLKASYRPADFNLNEGDTISAAGSDDPDIYIVNEHGYKRLFLNPIIFSFYGHLRGFGNVRGISGDVRNAFPTSGLFRNCEANAEEVYAVEVSGEDTGTLHHVNMSGEQAVAEDSEFFKKVFCINNNEFNWYTNNGQSFGAPYTSLVQVRVYARAGE